MTKGQGLDFERTKPPLNLSDEWLVYIEQWKSTHTLNFPPQLLHPEYGIPVISHSQYYSWDRCQFQWGLSYIDGWKLAKSKKHLEMGSMVHKVLEVTENGGDENSRKDLVTTWMEDPQMTGETLNSIAIVSWVTKKYIEEYQPGADHGFRVLKFHDEPMIEFHFEIFVASPDGLPYIIQGYIDKAYVDEMNRLWIRDYKTYSRNPITPMEAMMDPQLPMYAAALIEGGLEIHGLEYECINVYDYKDKSKIPNEKLFKRERTSRTKRELVAVLTEVGYAVDDIQNRRPKLRRSLRKECGKMCDFNAPCLYGLKGIDPNSIMDGDYVRKEAYKALDRREADSMAATAAMFDNKE